MSGGRFHGLRYLAISVVLFGGIWPLTKAALADSTPLWFAFNRAAMAAVVSAGLLVVLGRWVWPVRADLPVVLGIGLLQLGGFFALSHLALDHVPAGRTAVLASVTLFWLVPLSVWLLREPVSRNQWLAAAIGFGGVLVLIQPWSLRPTGDAALGYAMLLTCSLFWSLAIIITRRWPARRPVMELLPWCFGLAALLLLPLALLREPLAAGGGIRRAAWPAAIFVGAIAAPLGTWATIEAGRRLSGVLASVGFLMVPTLGVLLSSLWLREPLGWDFSISGALIVLSVLLAARG